MFSVALNFTSVDPIKALFWSAVINGVLAAPVMVMLMLLVRNCKVMGDLIVQVRLACSGGPRPSLWPSASSVCLSAYYFCPDGPSRAETRASASECFSPKDRSLRGGYDRPPSMAPLRIPMKSPGHSEMMPPMDSDMMSPRARASLAAEVVTSLGVDGQSFLACFARLRRRLWPVRSMRWALWTRRSRMASA